MSLQFDAAPDELAVFLEEAEEQLQLLDRDILILEKEGQNPEILQEVFRAAHTLKGSSGAIGHRRMASLTHAMESILDRLRRGKLTTSTPLVNVLLQSLDALRVLKEEVITLEDSGLDPSSLVDSLNQFIEENVNADSQRDHTVEAQHLDANNASLQNISAAQGEHSFIITVHVDRESPFQAARLLQAYLTMSEIGTITTMSPSREDIETEQVGTELGMTLLTNEDSHRIRDLIMAINDIVAVRIGNTEVEGDVVAEQDAFNSDTLIPESASQAQAPANDGKAKESSTQERQPTVRNSPTSKTVRIDVERLDILMNLVGELVIDCTRLVQLSSRLHSRYEGEEVVQGIGETSLHIQRITDELQDRIMKARMFPVSSVFSRFPRMVRDLAQRAGKQVEFIMEGEETELDRSVIEEISDPLIHLLRNAVDHGIETPAERVARGKPETGTIRLSACHQENRIVLTVEDDGKGIDPERIRQVATEKGLLAAEAAARLGDREAIELIFVPGFSTAGQITDVSGRGVGMDIVRTNIRKLNGQVGAESTFGRGSRFSLELPLTLAIMDALLVNLNDSIFAIPLSTVTETLRVRRSEVSSINGGKVIQLRGRVLRLMPLGEALGIDSYHQDIDRASVVVVSAGSDQAGIVVDSLVGEQQVVIKSLGNYIGDIRGLSGATILGDGRVALILDVPALVRKTLQERTGEVVYV